MSVEADLLQLAQCDPRTGPQDLIRLCLFDWAACALAGKDEPVAQILAMQANVEGDASVLGGGHTSAADAALINGTTGHALDYDDTHFDHIGHTSAVVMPAVLALAEEQMIDDLAAVADAALIGSEAAVRTGIWLGRDHYQIGYHQTATAGALGAALGCARLLNLSPQKTAHAIGLAATGASGLKGQFGTMGKPLNAGLAARCAVESVLWAQAGMTSDAAGITQFGATHHGIADSSAWDTAEPWKISRVSHKFHACCHGLHAMLEALRGMTGDVMDIQVATHPRWMSVCNQATPTTGLGIKFSFRMTAAMALSGLDTGDIANFSDDRAADPALVKLRDAVSVTADDTLSEMQTRVVVRFADGTSQTLFHDLSTPLPIDDRRTRLQQKAWSIVGAKHADALFTATQGSDVDPLMAILRN